MASPNTSATTNLDNNSFLLSPLPYPQSNHFESVCIHFSLHVVYTHSSTRLTKILIFLLIFTLFRLSHNRNCRYGNAFYTISSISTRWQFMVLGTWFHRLFLIWFCSKFFFHFTKFSAICGGYVKKWSQSNKVDRWNKK